MPDQLLRRIACLVLIAEKKAKLPGRLGKTAMQKLVYLLQSLFGVPLGYRFGLYTYGPYDAGVMRDIDYGTSLGVLEVQYNGDRGYLIGVGPETATIQGQIDSLIADAGEQLSSLIEHFGSMSSRDLELRATMVFVKRDDPGISDDGLIAMTKELKPKFDESELRAALTDLHRTGQFQPILGSA